MPKTWDEQMMENPLGAVRAGPFTFGSYYEINGDGSREHDARVTVFEMELLCKHWAKQIRSVHEEYAYYGQGGSWTIRMRPYASMRLDFFAQFLGEEKVQEIVNEVFEDFDPPDEPYGWEEEPD